jgi:hypothetical protein
VRSARDRRLSVLGATRLLLHPFALGSLLALIGIAAAEIAWPGARHFFSTYPVSVGLLTGLITLAFTLSIVNQFVEQRAALRWTDVREITLKGLNDEIRTTRDILWTALYGRPPYELNSRLSAAVDIAEKRGLDWPDRALGLMPALKALVPDGQWTQAGAAILRVATQEIREGLVRWAPTTALARGDYRILSPVASLADVIEDLEFPFAPHRRVDGSVAQKYRDPLCELWCHALATCIYVEEKIVRLLNPPVHDGWESRARELLSDEGEAEVNRWHQHAEAFEQTTGERENALTSLLDKPW